MANVYRTDLIESQLIFHYTQVKFIRSMKGTIGTYCVEREPQSIRCNSIANQRNHWYRMESNCESSKKISYSFIEFSFNVFLNVAMNKTRIFQGLLAHNQAIYSYIFQLWKCSQYNETYDIPSPCIQ